MLKIYHKNQKVIVHNLNLLSLMNQKVHKQHNRLKHKLLLYLHNNLHIHQHSNHKEKLNIQTYKQLNNILALIKIQKIDVSQTVH